MKRTRDDASALAMTPAPAVREHQGFASLPLSVLGHVWNLAVGTESDDGVCESADHQMVMAKLHNMKLVCRAWRDAVDQLTRERLHNVAIVDVAAATKIHEDKTKPLVLTLEPGEPQATVTDVRIVMGDVFQSLDYKDSGFWTDTEQALLCIRVERDPLFIKDEIPEIDWEATLAPHGANITRFDLSRMLFYGKHLGALLRAAAKLCPNVKALLLPPREHKQFKNKEVYIDNMKALGEALKAWHDANGGLTHLRTAFLGWDHITVVEYVNNLANYCPNLEHFDGWKFSFFDQVEMEFVTCDEFISGAPEQWGAFWENANKLRAFNTVVVPFTPDYYCEMLEQPKPLLEHLTISYHSLLSYPSEEMDSELFCDFVQQFPGLRKLDLVCSEAGDEWSASDAFDDKFVGAVVKNCPKLEEFHARSFNDLENLTMKSVTALLEMPQLKHVLIHSIVELDNSFADLIADRVEKKRELRLRLKVSRVRDTMWDVLSRVAKMKPEQLKDAVLTLSLQTHEAHGYMHVAGDKVNGRKHTAKQVKELYEEIKRVHGNTVRVHIHTTLPSSKKKTVQFDSVEISINDPQGFYCNRSKVFEVGNEGIELDLCGDDTRKDGVYERDPKGSMEDLEQLQYMTRRARHVHVPGVMSDQEDDMHDEGGGFFFDGPMFLSDGDEIEDEDEDDDDDEGDGDGLDDEVDGEEEE